MIFLFSGGGSGLMGSVVGGSVGHMLSDKAARKAAKKAAKHGQYPQGQYPQGQYPPGHNPSGESFNFTFILFSNSYQLFQRQMIIVVQLVPAQPRDFRIRFNCIIFKLNEFVFYVCRLRKSFRSQM
jgi:hypothetical protein